MKHGDQRQGVKIHQKEFEELMKQFDATTLKPKGTSEIIYRVPISFAKELSIWVYSTIYRKTRVSRELGADAIRIVMFYQDKKAVMREPKTLRKGKWKENITRKIENLKNRATEYRCPEGHPLVVRERKVDGKPFHGCAAFPQCKYIYQGEKPLSKVYEP
ncbi:MAG: hypothetical protein ACXAEI_04405 [Candidatus Hodarchaeales archaeon]